MNDIKRIANNVKKFTGISIAIIKKLIELEKLTNKTTEELKSSFFYREHISGAGSYNVSNQTYTALDFAIRGITDSLKLKSNAHNCSGVIFWSKDALVHKRQHGIKNFAKFFSCEHTIPIAVLREKFINYVKNNDIQNIYKLSEMIIKMQIVSTITKDENKNSMAEIFDIKYPFSKYMFKIYNINTLEDVSHWSIYDIQGYYITHNIIGNILKFLQQDIGDSEIIINKGKYYIEYGAKRSYHRIPDIKNFMKDDHNYLLKNFYTHKINYNRKKKVRE